MDAQGRNKALFRAKLNAQKKEKRIDSPLISYNESDQPVCRVCDVVLKSVSHWDAHQASRKHHEVMSFSLYDPQNLDKNSLPKVGSKCCYNANVRTHQACSMMLSAFGSSL
ncbi:hypothetical protein Goshw_028525 [Gossypium schwendimanii]|uniref:C2H2-type domain-containing protein n=4 Tax=Gossypium TaxID=3633 RepID=A0A0D2VK69_GOSRA|nr:hypothetical protein B456_011G090700 [Gossypium raimondii]MBA0599409.1 hypothetical protein [Gossypium raimondii]MBA0724570.1 hypothetical protein [Gossypium laxum]MBA0779490.1 hypothetical protein [Gossypium trilobum]MBA0871642.1 hypothetical protein [Gossypium schwendimanii]